jgi:hypothetical protein
MPIEVRIVLYSIGLLITIGSICITIWVVWEFIRYLKRKGGEKG